MIASAILIVIGCQIYQSAKIVIEWSTATELDTVGYNLYRSQVQTDFGEKINAELIPTGQDLVTTNTYSYVDRNVQAGERYYYWLEDVDRQGQTSKSDPFEIEAGHQYEGLLLMLLGVCLSMGMGLIFIQHKRWFKKQNSIPSVEVAGKEQAEQYD